MISADDELQHCKSIMFFHVLATANQRAYTPQEAAPARDGTARPVGRGGWNPVASLGLVSPGAATEGLIPIFS